MHGTDLNISQVIEKPNKMTVYGEAYMPFTEDIGGDRQRASGTVEVTRATA
jgi:hypothetical protein